MKPRRALLTGVGLIGLTGLIVAIDIAARSDFPSQWYDWYTDGRHEANVFVTVNAKMGSLACEDKEYPIWIAIKNNSARTVKNVMFDLVAENPGHSTNLISDNHYADDHILAPGERVDLCYRVPSFYGRAPAINDLEWSVDHKLVLFRD